MAGAADLQMHGQTIPTEQAAIKKVVLDVDKDPQRSIADLLARLLLVAEQVQSTVDRTTQCITAITPSPFVISPIRPVAEPLWSDCRFTHETT
jgi:hypothetical protein